MDRITRVLLIYVFVLFCIVLLFVKPQAEMIKDSRIRCEVAKNPNTPVEVLKELAKDEDYRVRQEVARNPNTPAEVLKELAKDINYKVRREVARNPNTPGEILLDLAKEIEGVKSYQQKKFYMNFGNGWGLYRMTDINRYHIAEIDNGFNSFGEVGYFVVPKISVTIGLSYLHGSGKGKFEVEFYDAYGSLVEIDHVKIERRAILFAPEIRFKYHFVETKMNAFVGGGIGWGFGEAKGSGEWDDGFVYKATAKANGIGFLASTGWSYNLNTTSSLGIEMGYRHYEIGKQKESNIYGGGANLDFSGAFMLATLSIRL
jgi:hypothetical protein